MVRALVEEPSLVPVQAAAVEATAATWPLAGGDFSALLEGCHAVLIGPGLGRSGEARAPARDGAGSLAGPDGA